MLLLLLLLAVLTRSWVVLLAAIPIGRSGASSHGVGVGVVVVAVVADREAVHSVQIATYLLMDGWMDGGLYGACVWMGGGCHL